MNESVGRLTESRPRDDRKNPSAIIPVPWIGREDPGERLKRRREEYRKDDFGRIRRRPANVAANAFTAHDICIRATLMRYAEFFIFTFIFILHLLYYIMYCIR